MALNFLQKMKEFAWSSGEMAATCPPDTSNPYFNSSEIALLKRQAREASQEAKAARSRRGNGKVNPRIEAARQAGANI